ncbi:hypothetical protein C6497_11850 [Candidatus Poribacteria bacterium]|nr:MAG: hypothetical protein C6497_11850 [Candidatus Poribacteria bacterium]
MKSSKSKPLLNIETISNAISLVYIKIAIILASICILSIPVEAEETPIPDKNQEETVKPTSDDNDNQSEPTKEVITGTSDRMERDQKNGITILIGNARTVRKNEEDVEIGFLNADKITLKSDTETGETVEIIAEGNVEIRDQDMFATCEHAIMNNLTNIIVLKDKVIVTQNKDKLETKLFTYNRTTGKQTGEGDVKFKVSITQANPIQEENSEDKKDKPDDESTSNDSESEKSDATQESSKDNSKETEKQDTSTEDNSDSDTSDNENEESEEEDETDDESISDESSEG